jgi:hypothetical protein
MQTICTGLFYALQATFRAFSEIKILSQQLDCFPILKPFSQNYSQLVAAAVFTLDTPHALYLPPFPTFSHIFPFLNLLVLFHRLSLPFLTFSRFSNHLSYFKVITL